MNDEREYGPRLTEFVLNSNILITKKKHLF